MAFDNQTSMPAAGASMPVPLGQIDRDVTHTAVQAAASSPVRPSSPGGIVDGKAAHPVDQLANLIARFVFLKKPCLYRLLALWVASTHIYSDFDFCGYIFAFSPEPQSGKSTLLEVLSLVVANTEGIEVSPTEATLFRTADGQTQFLDELDGIANQDLLRNVLNAGYRKGAVVRRMQESDDGEYKARPFPVYAPRVLAGIGSRILSPATRQRTFSIEMVRQLRAERRERFQTRKIKAEADAIKSSVAIWMGQNKEAIIRCYENFDFPYLEKLSDRTRDIALPLASILEVAYKSDPAVIEEFLEAIAITRDEAQVVNDDHKILQVLNDLARSEDPLVGNATELAQRCSEALGQPPENIPIAAVLRKYAFETKSLRTDKTGTPRYRYSLPLEALVEILSRYGTVASEAAASHGRAEASA